DIDDGDGRPCLHDAGEERLHDELSPLAIEGADEGQGEDAFPQLHHRGGELEHGALLTRDYVLAALLEDLDGVEGELVDEYVDEPGLRGEGGRILGEVALETREDRLLDREHEGRGLRVGESLPGSRLRDRGKNIAQYL